MSREEIVKAYRSLYRSGLRAVQFAKPARYQLRDQLREAFRSKALPPSASITVPSPASASSVSAFDPERIRRTVWFFNAAAGSRGLEHKIVKNLLLTNYWRRRNEKNTWEKIVKLPKREKDYVEREAYKHYDATIAMLNESMGLCLR